MGPPDRPAQEPLVWPAGVTPPRTVFDLTTAFDRQLRAGRLVNYRPVPTGFTPLDELLGGGVQAGDLVLLGGPQGVGKTVAVLQMARAVARVDGQMALVVCFEHTELYLFERLLSLASIDPAERTPAGLTRAALRQALLTARQQAPADPGLSLDWVLARLPGAQRAWNELLPYWERLCLIRGSARRTTVEVIEKYIGWARQQGYPQVVVFVDYLQKVPYLPPLGVPEPDTHGRVGQVVSGLKDVALANDAPIVAVAAADQDGLRRGRVRLANLLGPSLVQYECDTAILMNPSPEGVLWSVEKNRAGPTGAEMTFRLHGPYFCFDPVARAVRWGPAHGQTDETPVGGAGV